MKTLIDEDAVQRGVAELAERIRIDYGHQPLTVIGIMTGSIVLLADLIRKLNMPLRVGVVQASSYRGGTERGELVVDADWMPDVQGHDILLVDDIFDTGHTLKRILEQLKPSGAASIRSAVLLTKKGRTEVDIRPDYNVFDIPDEFVVGYGLDYQDEYRHLPYIAALEESDLS